MKLFQDCMVGLEPRLMKRTPTVCSNKIGTYLIDTMEISYRVANEDPTGSTRSTPAIWGQLNLAFMTVLKVPS
jgi:hypothetical protein